MKADDKPRVERIVPYARDSFFSGREFTDLPAMRSQAASWSFSVAGQRAARPLAGAKPAAIFAALEAEHLLALPQRPFEAASWQTAKVSPDCHISVGGALYSVPFRFIGARLDVRITDAMLFAYANHELVKSHVRVRQRPPLDRLAGLPLGQGGLLHAHSVVVPSPRR